MLTKAGYQTFGENPTAITGSFRYTAQRFDAETAGSVSQPSGLYYYRARMYSPTWARFLQSDPAGYPAGMNLYAYVLNGPMNLTDPTGMAPDEELDLEPKIEPQAGATGSGGGGYWLVGNIAAAAAGGSGGGGGGDDEFGNNNGNLSAGLGIDASEEEDDNTEQAGLTLYRGGASDSPAYENALNGIANPRGGSATALEHSLGNTESDFTSWTSDPDVALKFATGNFTTSGVVLTNTFAPGVANPVAPNVEAIMGESEYLVSGYTYGSSTLKVSP